LHQRRIGTIIAGPFHCGGSFKERAKTTKGGELSMGQADDKSYNWHEYAMSIKKPQVVLRAAAVPFQGACEFFLLRKTAGWGWLDVRSLSFVQANANLIWEE
jgi:hypothetical protein